MVLYCLTVFICVEFYNTNFDIYYNLMISRILTNYYFVLELFNEDVLDKVPYKKLLKNRI